jgi:hypothetical protein
MGAAAPLGRDASILSPPSQAYGADEERARRSAALLIDERSASVALACPQRQRWELAFGTPLGTRKPEPVRARLRGDDPTNPVQRRPSRGWITGQSPPHVRASRPSSSRSPCRAGGRSLGWRRAVPERARGRLDRYARAAVARSRTWCGRAGDERPSSRLQRARPGSAAAPAPSFASSLARRPR